MEEEVHETNLSVHFIVEAIGIGLAMIQMAYSLSITHTLRVLAKNVRGFNFSSQEMNPIFPLGESQLTPTHEVMAMEKFFMIMSMVTVVIGGLHATVLLKNRLVFCQHFLNCIPLTFSIIHFVAASHYSTITYSNYLKHQMYSHLEETYPNMLIYRACLFNLKDIQEKAQSLVLGPVLEEKKRILESIGMCPPELDRTVCAILSELIGILLMISFLLGVDIYRWPYSFFWNRDELGGIDAEIRLEVLRRVAIARANERAVNERAVIERAVNGRAAIVNGMGGVLNRQVRQVHVQIDRQGVNEEIERPRPRPRRLEDIDFEDLPHDPYDNHIFRIPEL